MELNRILGLLKENKFEPNLILGLFERTKNKTELHWKELIDRLRDWILWLRCNNWERIRGFQLRESISYVRCICQIYPYKRTVSNVPSSNKLIFFCFFLFDGSSYSCCGSYKIGSDGLTRISCQNILKFWLIKNGWCKIISLEQLFTQQHVSKF